MTTESGNPAKPGDKAPEGTPKRMSGILMISLFMSVGGTMMVRSLIPLIILPIGGLILAIVGLRRVRRDPNLIGPKFAYICLALGIICTGFLGYRIYISMPVWSFHRVIREDLIAFLSALDAREHDRVYELMSDEYREAHPLKDVREAFDPVFPPGISVAEPQDWTIPDARVDVVGLSSDGARLVVGSPTLRRPFHVWDIGNEQHEAEFGSKRLPFSVVAVSGNGNRVLSATYGRSAVAWDTGTHDTVGGFSGHEGVITAAALSSDGRIAVTGSLSGEVMVWKTAAEGVEHDLKGHESAIVAVVISKDDKRVITGDVEGTIRLWSIETGVEQFSLAVGGGHARPLLFFSDELQVGVGVGKALAVYDVSTGEKVREVAVHTEKVTAACAMANGRILTGSADGTVRIWDAANGEEALKLGDFDDGVTCVAVSDDGRYAGAGSSGARVKLWKLPDGDEAASLDVADQDARIDVERDFWFSQGGGKEFHKVLLYRHGEGNDAVELTFHFEVEKLGYTDFRAQIVDVHARRLSDTTVILEAEPDAEDAPGDGQDEPR